MIVETDAGDWKAGTDALAICMICGAEYEPGTKVCPDCNVSLSVVRRCPGCHRIVSAQHTKCVYCHTPFTHELPKDLPPDMAPILSQRALSERERRIRAAAVSVMTFVVMFCLGVVFLRRATQPETPVHVIARSYILHAVELRRAPSLSSAVVDKVAPGVTVNLTGFRTVEGQRWMTLDWNNAVVYVPAVDLAPPKVVDMNEGANALKFYLLGMETTESVDEAVKSVDYYTRVFPGDAHGEELRWVLAERIRYLSQHAGPAEANLRRLAHQQYEELAASNGKYAGKAHDTLRGMPSFSQEETPPRRPNRKVNGLQVVGGSGTQTSSASSTAHEVLVLNKAEVMVRAGKLSQLTAGAVFSGRVARQVKTNGIVAIPAGAICQLEVLSADPSQANVSLGLTSIEIDHRAYAVKSAAIEIPSGDGAKQIDRALVFHLDKPLVIER
jgi:hypothetical protein